MQELLQRLDQEARREAGLSLAAETQEREAAARLRAARDVESVAEARAKTLVERAKAEAAALLADVRRAGHGGGGRLPRAGGCRHTLDESRRRLRDVSARLAPEPEATPPDAPRPVLVAGTRVSAEHLGVSGEIVSIAGHTATVRSGSITVRVPVA